MKNQNAPRRSEHPPVRRGGNVKTFRWDQRLQTQNLLWHLNGFPDGNCCWFTLFSVLVANSKKLLHTVADPDRVYCPARAELENLSQIRTRKAKRFVVETHHFRIQQQQRTHTTASTTAACVRHVLRITRLQGATTKRQP